MPTTIEERLAEMGRQIDALQAKARSGAAEKRIESQLEALRDQEASARAAAKDAAAAFDEKFEQFQARLRVARSALAADLAESRQSYADAVDGELHEWDAYLERLQAQTALRAATARQQAETAISELRRYRNVVAERVAAGRAASGDSWEEQKQRILAARDELERKAAHLAAKFD